MARRTKGSFNGIPNYWFDTQGRITEHTATMIILIISGQSFIEVGKVLGCVNSVIYKIWDEATEGKVARKIIPRGGISGQKYPKGHWFTMRTPVKPTENTYQLVELKESGKTSHELAALYKMSCTGIDYLLARYKKVTGKRISRPLKKWVQLDLFGY